MAPILGLTMIVNFMFSDSFNEIKLFPSVSASSCEKIKGPNEIFGLKIKLGGRVEVVSN